MYARLRGVFEEQIPTVVQTLIEALMLENHADKLVANYRFVLWGKLKKTIGNTDMLSPRQNGRHFVGNIFKFSKF